MYRFRVISYNTHRSRGMDWRVRPERIVNVLHRLRGDIIALQEVFEEQAQFLAEKIDLPRVFGPAQKLHGRDYGNLIFSRLPVVDSRNLDVSVPKYEERSCLRADIQLASGDILHFFALHLGTSFFERRQQASRLNSEEVLGSTDLKGPRIVTGDFNEWSRGLVTKTLSKAMQAADPRAHLGRRRTYPGLLPFLHLDHLYYDPPLRLTRLHVDNTPAALIASDHLPLVGDFEWG